MNTLKLNKCPSSQEINRKKKKTNKETEAIKTSQKKKKKYIFTVQVNYFADPKPTFYCTDARNYDSN